MALSLKAYNDASLASVLSNLNVLQRSDGNTGPVDLVFYLGSEVPGKKIQAASDPGVDVITLGIVDADAGSGQPSTAVKLATSAAGLDSAVGGVGLSLPVQILSGAANALEIHARIEAADLTVGTYTDISLVTNELLESDA